MQQLYFIYLLSCKILDFRHLIIWRKIIGNNDIQVFFAKWSRKWKRLFNFLNHISHYPILLSPTFLSEIHFPMLTWTRTVAYLPNPTGCFYMISYYKPACFVSLFLPFLYTRYLKFIKNKLEREDRFQYPKINIHITWYHT